MAFVFKKEAEGVYSCHFLEQIFENLQKHSIFANPKNKKNYDYENKTTPVGNERQFCYLSDGKFQKYCCLCGGGYGVAYTGANC